MKNYRYTTIRCSKATKKTLEEARKGQAWDGFLVGLTCPRMESPIQSPDSPPAPALSNIPPCHKNARILHLGIYYCCQKPPRMSKLDTLQICVVCMEAWKNKTGVSHAPLDAKTPDPMKPATWKDKRYCGMEGGIWVTQERCESGECQNKICSWARAARERRKREQEVMT